MILKILWLVLLPIAFVGARNIISISRRPPPVQETALMARYIVNEADWASVATVSVRKNTQNYPFVNLVSISDGPKQDGKGIIYMYLSPLDFTGEDLQKDQRVTVMITLAQGSYCYDKRYDPMDPRCPRVIFSGKIKQVPKESNDYRKAEAAFEARHKGLIMPSNHHFYLAKLDIETISLTDKFGPSASVASDEYYNASQSAVKEYGHHYRK